MYYHNIFGILLVGLVLNQCWQYGSDRPFDSIFPALPTAYNFYGIVYIKHEKYRPPGNISGR